MEDRIFAKMFKPQSPGDQSSRRCSNLSFATIDAPQANKGFKADPGRRLCKSLDLKITSSTLWSHSWRFPVTSLLSSSICQVTCSSSSAKANSGLESDWLFESTPASVAFAAICDSFISHNWGLWLWKSSCMMLQESPASRRRYSANDSSPTAVVSSNFFEASCDSDFPKRVFLENNDGSGAPIRASRVDTLQVVSTPQVPSDNTSANDEGTDSQITKTHLTKKCNSRLGCWPGYPSRDLPSNTPNSNFPHHPYDQRTHW